MKQDGVDDEEDVDKTLQECPNLQHFRGKLLGSFLNSIGVSQLCDFTTHCIDNKDSVAKCPFFLHRSGLSNQILPQEKHTNCDNFKTIHAIYLTKCKNLNYMIKYDPK